MILNIKEGNMLNHYAQSAFEAYKALEEYMVAQALTA